MGFFIIVIGFIIGAVYLYQTQIGKVVWCGHCNKWSQMKLQTAPIRGYVCPNCKWINQEKQGACPTCGWYGKYANGTISRRGPFRKVERHPINLSYGWQEEYWAYEEQIKCPKHGIFTAYIPVEVYQRSYEHQEEDDYEDRYYDDEDQYYDNHETYDDEYHPRGL